jgi:hypothetical protein
MNQEVCPMQIYTVPGGAGTGITVFHFQVRFRIGRTLSTFSVCTGYSTTVLYCTVVDTNVLTLYTCACRPTTFRKKPGTSKWGTQTAAPLF